MTKITALLFLLFVAGCVSSGADYSRLYTSGSRVTAPEIAPMTQPVMIARPWCGIGC